MQESYDRLFARLVALHRLVQAVVAHLDDEPDQLVSRLVHGGLLVLQAQGAAYWRVQGSKLALQLCVGMDRKEAEQLAGPAGPAVMALAGGGPWVTPPGEHPPVLAVQVPGSAGTVGVLGFVGPIGRPSFEPADSHIAEILAAWMGAVDAQSRWRRVAETRTGHLEAALAIALAAQRRSRPAEVAADVLDVLVPAIGADGGGLFLRQDQGLVRLVVVPDEATALVPERLPARVLEKLSAGKVWRGP